MKTIERFLSCVEPRICSRGVQYYESGKVERLVRNGLHYSAQVSGSAYEPYEVDILLSKDNRVEGWDCNCPYDGGEVCKHVVAALLALQNGEAEEENKKKSAAGKTGDKPAVSLEALLSNASREALEALILEHAKEDDRFYANALSALGAPAEQELTAAKEFIRASIRRNTHRGSIDVRGCDAICDDMYEVLEQAGRHMEQGRYASALTLAQEMLVAGVKLASEADSSSGSLSDITAVCLSLLGDAAAHIQSGAPEEKRAAFDGILKAAKSKAFDDWDQYRYDLLNCAAQLAEKKSAPKLNALLDTLLASARKSEYSREYMIEANMETRFRLIETMEGPEAARAFLAQRLELNRCRKLAVLMDIEAGDYACAEKLCLEKAETASPNPYSRPSRWHDLLCEIYRASGQEEKLTAQLRTMLLLGRLDCYDELKKRLKAKGCWAKEYPPLLEAIAAARPSYEYMQILDSESEFALLMQQVEENPDMAFTYGDRLAKQYPQRVYALCVPQIRAAGARGQNRRDYQRLCALLVQLAGFGGLAEARRLIIELREAYPRRSALQEELAKTERRLTK